MKGVVPKLSLNIKDRVAIAVAVLFVVAMAVSSAIQTNALREDFTRVLSEQQYSLVKRMAREIDSKFATSVGALAGTAAFITPRDLAQPAALREQVHQRPALLAFFDDVLVLSAEGVIVVDYPEVAGRSGIDASDRAFFKQVMRTHQSVISEPLLGKTRGEPIVQVAAPILTPDDRVLGVLVGVIRLYGETFLGPLNEERIGTSGYFALITRGPKPMYVAHPDRKRILKERVDNPNKIVQNAIDGFEGTAEGLSSLGVETIYSSQLLKAVPWVLIAAAPKSEVYAPLGEAQRRLWMVTGGAIIALVPIVWLIVWFMLGPLRHLRVSMVGMREGEGEFVPVPVKRADEVGDITNAFNLLMRERLGAERAQRESEARLRLIADNMPALISYLDADLRVQFANSCYRDWFGLDPEAMLGKRTDEIFTNPEYEEVMRHIRMALAGKPSIHEREVELRSGKRIVRTSFHPRVENGVVVGVYHMSTDITEDRKLHEELDRLARRDPLTGLHNRRSLMELLPAAIARSVRQDRWLALLFVDLDRFKEVNDSCGHDAGDEVLKAVGERLVACIRGEDSVARLGGDEFIVVLEGLRSPGDAEAVAAKIIAAIAEPIATSAGECRVGASVGIAAQQGAGAQGEELIKRADHAAYAAKSAGRGRYHLA